MTSPMNLKKQTLDELYDTRTLMASTIWELELGEEKKEIREKSNLCKLQIQLGILKLENAKVNILTQRVRLWVTSKRG